MPAGFQREASRALQFERNRQNSLGLGKKIGVASSKPISLARYWGLDALGYYPESRSARSNMTVSKTQKTPVSAKVKNVASDPCAICPCGTQARRVNMYPSARRRCQSARPQLVLEHSKYLQPKETVPCRGGGVTGKEKVWRITAFKKLKFLAFGMSRSGKITNVVKLILVLSLAIQKDGAIMYWTWPQ